MAPWLTNTIGTPVECLRVPTEAALREKVLKIQAGHGFTPRLTETGLERIVHVSDGRWVLDCACGNGCLAHPGGAEGWPRPVAICTECGNVYTPVFPKARKAVEAALLARPNVHTRHFIPCEATAAKRGMGRGELLEDLERENIEHGLPARKKGR